MMRKIAISLTILGAVLVALTQDVSLHAEVSVTLAETWVAITGEDRNACSRTAPCRTLERAIEATSTGGHLGVLDSGNFGPVHITKSISISNGGPGEAILSTPDV